MQPRLQADVVMEIREPFIRAKYEMKSWIPQPTGESPEQLNQLLCIAVTTSNLMRTIQLIAHGAEVRREEKWEGRRREESSERK